MSKMYLANFVCILRVCRLYVLSLNVQNLPGRHKIPYLRKAQTLSRTPLGDSSQLCLVVHVPIWVHLLYVLNSVILHLRRLQKANISFVICYYLCDFCCEFMVLRGAPFIIVCKQLFMNQVLRIQYHIMYCVVVSTMYLISRNLNIMFWG